MFLLICNEICLNYSNITKIGWEIASMSSFFVTPPFCFIIVTLGDESIVAIDHEWAVSDTASVAHTTFMRKNGATNKKLGTFPIKKLCEDNYRQY